MILDFDSMEETIIPQFYGGEKEYRTQRLVDDTVKIMRGRLIPGATIGMHTHETNYEVMYIIEGEATVLFDGERKTLKAGQAHYCPKGHTHSLINDGSSDVVFFAVVPNSP